MFDRQGVAKILFNEDISQLIKMDIFGSDEAFEFVFKQFSFNTSTEDKEFVGHIGKIE